jgi:signal transduction histidine kinase
MIREGRLGRVLLAFMAAGFLALIVAGIAAAWVQGRNQQHNAAVAHTYQVELTIAEARRLIEQGETARRGYMLAGDPAFLASYREVGAALPTVMDRVGALTIDNPLQQRHLALIDRLIDELSAERAASIAQVAGGNATRAIATFRAQGGAGRLRLMRRAFDAMGAEERRLLAIRDAEQAASIRVFYAILTFAGVVLGAVAIAALVVVLRYTRDLAGSRDNLRGLNENLEELVSDRTADLSRANEEIQRFAYIVSHDLRSPLVNVMGFTAELDASTKAIAELIDRAEETAPEIVTEEARLAARGDLPEAIGFIRTSTQKMDRLITAILTLSRQGRRVLTPEPLDVAAIVDEIRGSLAHRLDEQGTTVEVEGDLPAVVSDRLGVEQILSNLIENAVKYRHPTRPARIVVTGGSDGPRRWFAVTDNGRGIDPRDHERVFDLFRRSGTQDQPGEGIGLAHVRALAYRLGGIIDLTSTLGEGATFRLSLPKALELQEQRT